MPDSPESATVSQRCSAPRNAHLLFRRLVAGTETDRASVREALILMHMPLVKRIARHRSLRRGSQVEELYQAGAIGLIKAVDRFDHRRGTPFAAFAHIYIDGEIKRYFRDVGWAAHVPRNVKDRIIVVNQAARELAASLNRDPTAEEIAHEVGLKSDDVRQALVANRAWTARSLDVASPTLRDGIDTADPAAESAYDSVDNCQLLQRATDRLSTREQLIINLRFQCELTQAEIGRLLKMSQPQVSKAINRSLRKMRASLNHSAFVH
ncbi:sigma-70 family RNA polymerase sigma factor [Streptomyces sp. NPDC051577]|uniref:sigma-70 family RNA polymerase sigma factor n=1 Tax=Streptomyces sp. NPDC051577 TaxID=3155166 RepID=UPI00344555F6